MQVLATDIWHAFYNKSYRYSSSVHTSSDPKELVMNIEDYKIKKTTSIVISVMARFFTKDKKTEIGKFHCAIVVKIILNEEELKMKEEELRPTLEYTAVSQAWPLLNQAASQLKNIKIEFDKLPIPPSKEELINIKSNT